MKRLSNTDIARVFTDVAAYLAMEDDPFRPRAYEKAAETIHTLPEELSALYVREGHKGIRAIPSIGESIAAHIEELLATGKLAYLEDLKKKTPVKLDELLPIEGLGPKSIRKLYDALGITSRAELARAARAKKIRALAGFGEKAEENILKGIDFVARSVGRIPIGLVMPVVREIERSLAARKGVMRAIAAGSTRRRKETIGDIDILVVASDPDAVMDFFVRLPYVERVYAHGNTKSSVRLSMGIDADLRVVPAASCGAALNYFTGSKDHNMALRKIAIGRGWKLNEYGLYTMQRARGRAREWLRIAGKTEEEIYEKLGLDYIEPELREMRGEIEAARRHALPRLVGYGDLKGDLQTQTDWTDGKASIEEMARAATRRGLSYIAITDHTKRLAMTHGLDEKRILKQMAEIDRVNKKLKGTITVLTGTECDILEDGSLDLPDRVLARLDVVGVSVHSHFNLSEREQTERIIRAMESPHADVLFHPTGRVLGKRDPYRVDISAIVRAAKETGTILEIDALPTRADLNDEHIRMCVKAGVLLTIDSDAHAPEHFDYLECGIAQARRGWAEKKNIVNTRPLEEMMKFLKK